MRSGLSFVSVTNTSAQTHQSISWGMILIFCSYFFLPQNLFLVFTAEAVLQLLFSHLASGFYPGRLTIGDLIRQSRWRNLRLSALLKGAMLRVSEWLLMGIRPTALCFLAKVVNHRPTPPNCND